MATATLAQLQTVNTTLHALVAGLTTTTASLEATKAAKTDTDTFLPTGTANTFFLMICGILVFFMQAGFALLEAGSVRAKNTKNILMKNLLDACIGALIWWAWGYGIAYDNPGVGEKNYQGFIGAPVQDQPLHSFFTAGYNTLDDEGTAYAGWWFQFVFCAAAATIVSGAMAERTSLVGYLVYTVAISGFIYPVVVYWTWSGSGWVTNWNGGIIDFAGSGIVHMTGGIAAIVGAAVVGPRKGRFDEAKKPVAMPPHNTTFQVLGTFILWFGWYGFNPGSALGLVSSGGQGLVIARCIVTTTLSAAAGGLTVVLTDKVLISHTWDVGMLCNGILAGLVSITAGCANVFPWAAMLMGFLGGFVYLGASKCVLYICKIDDPLDAFAVHGACGAWGVISAGFFAATAFAGGDVNKEGAFYGGNGAVLGNGLVFILADLAWTGGLSLMMFVPLKLAGLLRVPPEMEDAGMDVSKHGGAAYQSSS